MEPFVAFPDWLAYRKPVRAIWPFDVPKPDGPNVIEIYSSPVLRKCCHEEHVRPGSELTQELFGETLSLH